MASGLYRFGDFELDATDRRLMRGGSTVELSARYLDALILLVGQEGRLVSKDRFMSEVWKGVPVTDEALTQCIRSLRRALGDEAGRPRFIETEPKYGYRFIAPVTVVADRPEPARAPAPSETGGPWRLVVAGVLGGALAGGIGGLIYGFLGASDPLQPGLGSGSIVMVLTCLTLLVAVTGAAGVSLGVAAADVLTRGPTVWRILGGAAGGMVVGALVKVLGLDGFSLLLGQSPGDITGGGAGAGIGAVVGLGVWLTGRMSLRRSIVVGAVIGMVGGLAVHLLGGRLLGGSLDLLASRFPQSRLDMGAVGRLVGESDFGPITQSVTSALEGGLFTACVVGAIWLASRSRA